MHTEIAVMFLIKVDGTVLAPVHTGLLKNSLSRRVSWRRV